MNGRTPHPTLTAFGHKHPGPRLTMIAVGLVLAGQLLGLPTKTPDGQTTFLAPAIGIVVLWMRLLIDEPRWWTTASFWRAAAIVAAIPPVLLAATGVPLLFALPRGPGTLVEGLVSALAWRALDQAGSRPAAKLWRLIVAMTIGAVADLPFAPVIIDPLNDLYLPTLVLWILRGAISTFVVVSLALAFLAPRSKLLDEPSSATTAAVFLVSGVTYVIGFQQPHSLYLLLPPTIWAATVFTIRGVALHATFTVVATGAAAVLRVGPFSGISPSDIAFTGTTFMLVVVFVALALVWQRESREMLAVDLEVRRQAAAQQAKLLHTLVTSVGDAVVIVDGRGQVLMDNQAIRDLVARTTGSLDELLAARGTDGGAPLRRVLDGADSHLVDVRVACPNGTEAVLAVRAFALRHSDTESAQAVVFVHDVTPARRHTDDLRAFAHTIAHDLRNPVTGICLAAEMGLEAAAAGDTHEAQDMLERILDTGDRLSNLINDITDFRVTSKSTLVRAAERVDDLVADVMQTRAAAIGDGGLRLEVDAAVTVDVDRRLIERVLDNLIGNAVKYAVPGEVACVDITAVDTLDGWVRVRVEDRGVGLPPGEEEKVFEQRHRVPEHTRLSSGNGIGLSICRDFVQRHGGRITATARPGGGTRFEMTLPSAADRPIEPPGAEVLRRQPPLRRS